MSIVASKVDDFRLEQYTHEYHLSLVLGFQVPSSSSYVHDAPPVVLALCHMSPIWNLVVNYQCYMYVIQLTSFLASDIPPKSIMLDDTVLDQNVDQMTLKPESPISLLWFGLNAFSIDQIMDISCHVICSAHVGSSRSTTIGPPGSVSSSRKRRHVISFDKFELFLHEISHVVPRCVSASSFGRVAPRPDAHAEKIISAALGRVLKFFAEFLNLRYRFLAAEVNLHVAEGMNLASEEMLVKAREMFADLSICNRDAVAKVASLDNQGMLGKRS
ncbi:unnamed protein product [Lactuca saligna]|uniref:Uncharacterized protein n=1 Tax=Lactuca saligna TaxID=75948 RepID=A0AA36DWM6_LACSI|nr:unnamed protein product [Lactuca saligna]